MTAIGKLAAKLYRAMRTQRDKLASVDDRTFNRRDNLMVTIAVDDARRNLLALDYPRWLGRELTVADRKACSRALAELESAGLIVRLVGASGTRTTHVKILAADRESTHDTGTVPL